MSIESGPKAASPPRTIATGRVSWRRAIRSPWYLPPARPPPCPPSTGGGFPSGRMSPQEVADALDRLGDVLGAVLPRLDHLGVGREVGDLVADRAGMERVDAGEDQHGGRTGPDEIPRDAEHELARPHSL